MRHRRTRSGCLTCRARRKKCDEHKPRCAGCRRNQLVCTWPSPTSRNPYGTGSELSPVVALAPVITTMSAPGSACHWGAVEGASQTRSCMRVPHSVHLFSHFLVNTVSIFAMGPLHRNPFVSVIVPQATADDLLMHAVLAASGAHMSSRVGSPEMSREISCATAMHYTRLIAGIREEVAEVANHDLGRKERLLSLLLMACHYETIAGNTSGAFFEHLFASRHLITSLVTSINQASDNGYPQLARDTLGFSIEMYTYMMLANLMVMPPKYRKHLSHIFVMPLEQMAMFSTFGAFFAGAHELYELIPEIERLASSRLAEEAEGKHEPSASLKAVYDTLYSRLCSWTLAGTPEGSFQKRDAELKTCAAEAWRHGLFIYLITALAGSLVPEDMKRSVLATHTIKCFTHIGQLLTSEEPYYATLLWPALVGSSCITQHEGQETMLHTLRVSWASLRHMSLWADVLQLMWDDPDPKAYGPYGLVTTMRKHDMVIGIL